MTPTRPRGGPIVVTGWNARAIASGSNTESEPACGTAAYSRRQIRSELEDFFGIDGDEPIELWDSGMPVTAEAGDTVATLAAKYTVPAWALAQINNLDEKATLQPGQRITVPRDLDAPPLPSGAPAISFAATAR